MTSQAESENREFTAESLAHSLYWEATSSIRKGQCNVAQRLLEVALEVFPHHENSLAIQDALITAEQVNDPERRKEELDRARLAPILVARDGQFLNKYKAKDVALTYSGIPILEKFERDYGIASHFQRCGPCAKLKEETLQFAKDLDGQDDAKAASEFQRLHTLYPQHFVFATLYISYLLNAGRYSDAKQIISLFRESSGHPLSLFFEDSVSKLEDAGSGPARDMAWADVLVGLKLNDILRIVGLEAAPHRLPVI